MTPEQPLARLRVLVTRPADQASRLSVALQNEGAEIVELPSIQIEPPLDWTPVDAAVGGGVYDWIVFTSANGVRFFVERVRLAGKDASWFGPCRVAAIGPETARTLESLGVKPALVPDEYVAEALVATMEDAVPLTGRRVLLPQADIGRDALAVGLEAAGAIVDRVVAYRTVLPVPAPAVLEQLRRGAIDLATFTSASTVRNLVTMLGTDVRALEKCVLACIGPVTAQAAVDLGLQPAIIATNSTIAGLMDAIRGYYVASVTVTGGSTR